MVYQPIPRTRKIKKSAKQIKDEQAFVKTFVKRYGNPSNPNVSFGTERKIYEKDRADFSTIKDPERFYNACPDCKHRKGEYPAMCMASKKIVKNFDPLRGTLTRVEIKSCSDVRGGNTWNPNPICDKFVAKFSLGKVLKEAFTSLTEEKKNEMVKTKTPATSEVERPSEVEPHVNTSKIDPDDMEADCLTDTDENQKPKTKTSWWQRIVNPSSYQE